MSEEQAQLDYEALNARTALDLSKAKQKIERLEAKCAQRRDDLKQARDILDERFKTIERLEAKGKLLLDCWNAAEDKVVRLEGEVDRLALIRLRVALVESDKKVQRLEKQLTTWRRHGVLGFTEDHIDRLEGDVERLTNMIGTWRETNDANWQDLMDVGVKKIERLEAALWRIAHNICISDGADLTMQQIAREALDKEQT